MKRKKGSGQRIVLTVELPSDRIQPEHVPLIANVGAICVRPSRRAGACSRRDQKGRNYAPCVPRQRHKPTLRISSTLQAERACPFPTWGGSECYTTLPTDRKERPQGRSFANVGANCVRPSRRVGTYLLRMAFRSRSPNMDFSRSSGESAFLEPLVAANRMKPTMR